MADRSGIGGTGGVDGLPAATWNPLTGYTLIAPGRADSAAAVFAERRRGEPGRLFEQGRDVRRWPERLMPPLRWRTPRRILLKSRSDIFDDRVEASWLAEIWATMACTPQHTYQILTARHQRMRALLGDPCFAAAVRRRALVTDLCWPLPNVWLGVSAADQRWTDVRVPALAQTPAAVRWLSLEPLLGPVDLHRHLRTGALEWIVVAGESGQRARPMHPAWVRTIRDAADVAGVPFYFKQWGTYAPAAVVDAPDFLGGRAFIHPTRGGVEAAIMVEPDTTGNFRTAVTRPMLPGDHGRMGVMLDRDTIAVRVGKHAAGRLLDGRIHEEYPRLAIAGV